MACIGSDLTQKETTDTLSKKFSKRCRDCLRSAKKQKQKEKTKPKVEKSSVPPWGEMSAVDPWRGNEEKLDVGSKASTHRCRPSSIWLDVKPHAAQYWMIKRFFSFCSAKLKAREGSGPSRRLLWWRTWIVETGRTFHTWTLFNSLTKETTPVCQISEKLKKCDFCSFQLKSNWN